MCGPLWLHHFRMDTNRPCGASFGRIVPVGAYHCVCMLTGVSLRPSDAVAVLLRQQGGQPYSPIALPVFGDFDSMGGVDSIREDANTALLVEFFAAQLQTGRFVATD